MISNSRTRASVGANGENMDFHNWVFKIFYNHGEPTIFAHLLLAFCICHMVILLRD